MDALEQELEELETQEAPQEETRKEPELPEKFKGKTLEDIVESYSNLEKEYGRKNNEVGELRKLTDQLLKLENEKQEVKKEPLSVDNLLDDPDTAINNLLNTHPRLKAIEDSITQSVIEKNRASFEAAHPDWREVVGSDSYQNWINSSPVRKKMFQEADRSYDYELGSEMIQLFKETQSASKKASEDKRKTALKDATLETGSTGESPTKIYRRTDLIELRMSDPEKFDAMQPEILRAYAEGRVK